MPTSTLLLTIVSGGIGLVYLGLEVALLVAVCVTVRKNRPDAWGVLAMGVALQMAGMLVSYLGSFAGSLLMGPIGAGVEGFVRMQTAVHMGASLISGTGKVMLILGIVRLARPEQPPMGMGDSTFR